MRRIEYALNKATDSVRNIEEITFGKVRTLRWPPDLNLTYRPRGGRSAALLVRMRGVAREVNILNIER